MAVGLGGEQLWLSPTVANNVNPFNDQSGQGNNGTAQGGLSTVADTGSGGAYAYDFDGVGDYIDTGSTTVHQNTLFTYSFWINASESLSSIAGAAGSYEKTGDNRGPLACSISGDGKLSWLYMSLGNTYNSAQQLKSVGNVYDSTWHHVVCEFDGNNNEAKIYIDGTLNTSTASSVPNTVNISTSLKFGLGSEGYTTGRMDDVRVYNRVLTEAEISWLATERGVLGTPPEGLGDEQLWVSPTLTSDDVSDISGNGNTALIDGTVPVVEDVTGYESFQTDNTTLGTDYVYFNAPSASDLPSASLAFWASSNFTTSYAPIGGFCTSGYNDQRFFIARKATLNVIRLYAKQASSGVTNTDISMPAGKSLTDSVMRHWAITCSGGIVFLYLDGVLIGQTATAFTSDLDIGGINLSLGSQDGRTTNGSAAKYDDIRFYDRALTQAEITHLASQRGVLGSPATTTQYNAFVTHAFRQLFQTRLR